MDRDQESSRRKKRKFDGVGSKKSAAKPSNSPRQEKHYPGANDLLMSLGKVSTADLEIDVEAVLDKMAAKDTKSGASDSKEFRHERTIASSRLASDCNKPLRLTYTSNSILKHSEIWQALREDLKIIGFVQENHAGSKPLFLSKYVFSNEIYCTVMLHLKLKYAARLALLRLFGKRATDNGMMQQERDNFIAEIRDFFANKVDAAQQKVRSRSLPNFAKDDLNTVRMRIVLPAELATTHQTWRPRTPVAFRDAFLMSFLKLKDCIEYFSTSNFPNNSQVDPIHAASNKDVNLLSDFVWTDGDPLATTRYRFLCGISSSIELSANFVLKQMFGRGQCMKDICKVILELDKCHKSGKTAQKKLRSSKSKQPYQ